MNKILKCIPSLLANGAVTQAANMINVVKASFEVSQEYKDEVCALPPHFITLMYDLYKDAIYSIDEVAMSNGNKDEAIIEAEKVFIEKSEKATKVLSNKAKILDALRKAMSAEYDKVVNNAAIEKEPTVLEKSMETTAAVNDTVNKMVEYVKLLKPEERLAMIYALGITNYVDVKNLTTASVDEISSEDLEEQIKEEVNPDKFGIYSISEIEKKLKEAMLSHKFIDEQETEHDVLYTVIENISDKTIDSIYAESKEKMDLPDSTTAITSIESLLDYLDDAGEILTSAVALPAHIVFIVKDDNICMVGVFDKNGVSELVKMKNETKI